jgi:hypothetical protein
MLKIILKDKKAKTSFEIENSSDYEGVMESCIKRVAQERVLRISESIRMLGELDSNVNTTELLSQLEEVRSDYIDEFSGDELDESEWIEGLEIVCAGDPSEIETFEHARSSGCSLKEWIEANEDLDLHHRAALYWHIVYSGDSLSTAINKLDDTIIYSDNLRNAAEVVYDENFLESIPEHSRNLIDYDHFAYCKRIGGELCEFQFAGKTWTAENR